MVGEEEGITSLALISHNIKMYLRNNRWYVSSVAKEVIPYGAAIIDLIMGFILHSMGT